MTTTTLKDACEAYVSYMKTKGQSASTLGTIQRTLALLVEEMGESKEVAKILTVHVDKFFKSERATQQPGKDGLKPRAQASILQIRRIVRMALVYWHEQGLISKVPVPGDDKRLIGKTEKRAKTQTEAAPGPSEPAEPQAAAASEQE